MSDPRGKRAVIMGQCPHELRIHFPVHRDQLKDVLLAELNHSIEDAVLRAVIESVVKLTNKRSSVSLDFRNRRCLAQDAFEKLRRCMR